MTVGACSLGAGNSARQGPGLCINVQPALADEHAWAVCVSQEEDKQKALAADPWKVVEAEAKPSSSGSSSSSGGPKQYPELELIVEPEERETVETTEQMKKWVFFLGLLQGGWMWWWCGAEGVGCGASGPVVLAAG